MVVCMNGSDDTITVPAGIRSLDDFRKWSISVTFPQTGRIDFLHREMVIDMSPEQYYEHSGPKVEIGRVLANLARAEDLGDVHLHSTRVVSPEALLSCEPDVLFISYDSLDAGRVRLVPGRRRHATDAIEIEGGPDLVVEVVSPSSMSKDLERLPTAYYAAGVREYWIVDARSKPLVFERLTRGASAFEHVPADEAGFRQSTVFGRKFRLVERQHARGHVVFDLLTRVE